LKTGLKDVEQQQQSSRETNDDLDVGTPVINHK
jgi:hypothetical protein